MTNVNRRPSSRKDAKNSRRARLRSRAAARGQRQLWRDPMRRMRSAIQSSFRLIETCSSIIDDTARLAAARPIRATRRLQRVAGLLAHAVTHLARAAHGLQATAESAALTPETASEAPGLLIESTLLWVDAAEQLNAVSERFDEAFATLLASVESGAVPIDFAELSRDSRPAVAAQRINPVRLFLAWNRSHKSDCARFFLKRRRRFAPAAVAEAAKKVFRGRAPPLVSICSL